MRLDLLLVRLRFAKSRAKAQELIERGHIRLDGRRVTGADERVAAGSVLTLPLGGLVRIVHILALPERRGPAREARLHYRYIDARPSNGLAGRRPGGEAPAEEGKLPP